MSQAPIKVQKADQEQERLARVYGHYFESGMQNSKWSIENPGNLSIAKERMRVLRDMLARVGMQDLGKVRILEVGCGGGRILRDLLSIGANASLLSGIDVLSDRIVAAKIDLPGVDLRVADARNLPFPDASIGLVLFFTVFSSILNHAIARQVAAEAARVLKLGGVAVCYDFQYRNPRNPHVRAIKRGEVENLFPGFTCSWRSLTLLPPLARKLGVFTKIFYPLLAAIPPFRTHLMAVLVKPK